MSHRTKIAVMGAGLIGQRHIEHVAHDATAELFAVVDPSPPSIAFAAGFGVPHFVSFQDMLTHGKPDGVIIATPNTLHTEHGLAAIAAGIPALVEKPITSSVEDGEKLVAAAENAGVLLLTGHHRRHNPIIARAKAIINSGQLGKLVALHGFFWLMKPDTYFLEPWRRAKGAGPVFMNLIHDVDLMRHLCGDIVAVQAMDSNAVRGNEVEEACVVLLRFANGMLGTVNVSDSVVAPWSWEHTASEHAVYPRVDETCLFIAGTRGSLSIPQLGLWTNPVEKPPGWYEPFVTTHTRAAEDDPLRLQVRQFVDCIRGKAKPLVSGRDGLETLRVIEAVKTAARTGAQVRIG